MCVFPKTHIKKKERNRYLLDQKVISNKITKSCTVVIVLEYTIFRQLIKIITIKVKTL